MGYVNEAAQYANQYKLMCDFTQPFYNVFQFFTNMELTRLPRRKWTMKKKKKGKKKKQRTQQTKSPERSCDLNQVSNNGSLLEKLIFLLSIFVFFVCVFLLFLLLLLFLSPSSFYSVSLTAKLSIMGGSQGLTCS